MGTPARNRPIHASKRSWSSLWQEYRVFSDRIELPSILGKKIIPADELVECEVRPPPVIWDLFRGQGFASVWTLKLDLADFAPHVALRRERGWFKRLRIAPPDPEAFVTACRSIAPRCK